MNRTEFILAATLVFHPLLHGGGHGLYAGELD